MIDYGDLIDPVLRDVRKFTPIFAGMSAGDRVIDVCCGTGAQVFEYARRGIIATGIDNDPVMLKIASRKAGNSDISGASISYADATALSRRKIVKEMKRVVRKGGSLVFIDFNYPLPLHPWTVLARAIEFIAGGEHYRGFKDYIARGGIDDVLGNNDLRQERRSYLKSGLMVAVKTTNGTAD